MEAYYSGQIRSSESQQMDAESLKRQAVFSQAIASKMQKLAAQTHKSNGGSMDLLLKDCFPAPKLGQDLLSALTKKMAQDSQTNAATLEVAKTLPEDFKKKLFSYFRRSSELLRHFFGT